MLVQWLRQSHAYPDHKDHSDSAKLITLDDRRKCRRWLHEQALHDPGILHLLEKEVEFLGIAWDGVQTVVE